MSKKNGLNTRLYVMGRDLSGDANSLDSIGYTQAELETTALNQDAPSRIVGLVDGTVTVNGFFDNASGAIHDVFSSNSGNLPTADQIVTIPLGSAIGDDALGLVSKEAEYNISRASGSAIGVTASFASTEGIKPEFAEMLTAFDDTHSSATNGTAIDNGASSANGASGYCHWFALSSGTVVVKIQHSADNASWSDLITFTSTGTSGVDTAERGSASGTVNRYVRVATTGTFSNAQIAVAFARL